MGNYCPDCGSALNKGATKCPCGWKAKESGKSAKGERGPIQCAFHGCPMPGWISASVNGGPFYCRWHWKAKKDGVSTQEMHAISDDLRMNPPKRTENWRDVMFDERMKGKKQAESCGSKHQLGGDDA